MNSVSSVLSHSHILCFADNIKIYFRISSLHNCILLQSYFDRFTKRFNFVGLSLNVSKCRTITFSRIQSPTTYSYHLGSTAISCFNGSVIDLEFILSSNLGPSPRIEHICCKTFKTLGFILGSCRNVKNVKNSHQFLFFFIGVSGKVVYGHTRTHTKYLGKVFYIAKVFNL